jgi:hypothetical protein
MNHQTYAETYRAAMDAATGELDGLFEEAKRLRNRMEQIDSAIIALKVLVGDDFETLSTRSAVHEISSGPVAKNQQIDSTLGLVFA